MTSHKKLVVLGLDGVPDTLLEEAFAVDKLPNLRRLSEGGTLVPMRSVIPTISSVAWTGFMTGQNPGKHGIFGFVDRDAGLERFIPTSHDVRTLTLWERLNGMGARTIAMNVPLTYPPKSVNGVLIGGFLGFNVDTIAHPASISSLLRDKGYVIDPDPRLATNDRAAFMEAIFQAFDARTDVARHLLEHEPWDFFMCHVMETDRLHHFFWPSKDDRTDPYHCDFWTLYERIDAFVGELVAGLPDETEVVLLSDHGFCGIRAEPDINAYLGQLGLTKFSPDAKDLSDLDSDSLAYSLPPGRIYLNLQDREPRGRVTPAEAERIKDDLTSALHELTDPETGDPVIQRVYRREELYDGPLAHRAADLIAHPHRGYDLKASIRPADVFTCGVRNGMHTYRDAFLLIRDHTIAPSTDPSIVDVAPTALALMGAPIPNDMDGQSVLESSPVQQAAVAKAEEGGLS
ncbi:MAG: alkaline phosphatase family protein [Salinibacter sp.]